MSGFGPGVRVLASWMGGGWQPATVLEVNTVGGLLRVQFDTGSEAWIGDSHAKLAPNLAPVRADDGKPAPTSPSAGNAANAVQNADSKVATAGESHDTTVDPRAPAMPTFGDFKPVGAATADTQLMPPSSTPTAPGGSPTPGEKR